MMQLHKILSLSLIAIFLSGCNSQLKNQVSDLEQEYSDLEQELAETEAELAETEAELEDQKTADEVWDELASKKTKNKRCKRYLKLRKRSSI